MAWKIHHRLMELEKLITLLEQCTVGTAIEKCLLLYWLVEWKGERDFKLFKK